MARSYYIYNDAKEVVAVTDQEFIDAKRSGVIASSLEEATKALAQLVEFFKKNTNEQIIQRLTEMPFDE